MYGLRIDLHFLQGFWDSSVSRYFVGVSCLPVNVVVVWVDRFLLCVNVVGLWRTWSSLCSCSVCVVSSMWELLSSVCIWAHILLSPTASFLFAFHWLMRWAFRFLVEGERYFFFWAWLATSPVSQLWSKSAWLILRWDKPVGPKLFFPIYTCVTGHR